MGWNNMKPFSIPGSEACQDETSFKEWAEQPSGCSCTGRLLMEMRSQCIIKSNEFYFTSLILDSTEPIKSPLLCIIVYSGVPRSI